jgi:hypothetical protein
MIDVIVPDGFSITFARAVRDFYIGGRKPETIRELRTRYGTEVYYMEAIEEIYAENGWKFDAKSKKLMRSVFRGEINF